jgi:hypothetical protein
MKPWSIVHCVYFHMRTIIICACLALSLTARGQSKLNDMKTSSLTISCKLTTPELQQRKATVIAALKSLVVNKKELEDGFLYRFNATDEMIDKLAEFIKTERMCCDFFIFSIKIEGEVIELSITGPAEAKQFLIEEVGF